MTPLARRVASVAGTVRQVASSAGAAGRRILPVRGYGTGMARLSKVCDLTGPGTSSERFGVVGTDLGIPVELPGGRELGWFFGDTFSGLGPGSGHWRSPVLLRSAMPHAADQHAGDASDGGTSANALEFCSCVGRKHARRLIRESNHRGVTWLPADALTVGGTTYLWAMRNAGLHNVTESRVFASRDGERWKRTRAAWPGSHHGGTMQLITWAEGAAGDDHVYVFSSGFQRDKPLFLHRVPTDGLLRPKQWESWGFRPETGWQWGNPPTPVLDGAWGEMCLRRVDGKYVLVWFDASAYSLRAMVLDHPTDNLFEARKLTLLTGCGWEDEDHAAGKVAQLYGGYIVPGSTLDAFTVSVSQWNTSTNETYKAMLFTGSLRG